MNGKPHNVMPLSAPPVPSEPVAPFEVAKPTVVNNAPTVTLFACGGFGINTARHCATDIGDLVALRRLDTSQANLRDGEDAIIISGTGSGAGKVRAAIAEQAQRALPVLTEAELTKPDIAVVLFSLSGGSGSVLGPLLVKDLARRGCDVVVITTADLGSEMDAQNTLNTIKSLESIAHGAGIYLPTMLFVNHHGRATTDREVRQQMLTLVHMLRAPTEELDRSDRRNWLNGVRTKVGQPGMRLLHVETLSQPPARSELWTDNTEHFYDAVLSIGVVKDHLPVFIDKQPRARVRYEGLYTTTMLAPALGMVGADGAAVKRLIQDIEDLLVQFAAQSNTTSFTGPASGGGGLVL